MTSYLITGGAGFIGSHLAKSLLKSASNTVFIVDNFSHESPHRIDTNKYPNLKYLQLDIHEQLEQLVPVMKTVDVLYHLAAVKHSPQAQVNNDRLKEINVIATENLFNLAAKCNIERIVFTSSLYVYGLQQKDIYQEDDKCIPHTAYGESKKYGEQCLHQIAKKYDINYAILRLFFVYGPGINTFLTLESMGYNSVILKHFYRLKENLPLTIYGSGNQILDYVHINDVVNALHAALHVKKNMPTVYNIGSNRKVTINEITSKILDIASQQARICHDAADWTDGTIRLANIALAENYLKWQPCVSLAKGLSSVYNWMNRD